MIPWADIETRRVEHEQRVQRIDQTHWRHAETLPAAAIDRWHWRVMSKLGGWLVELGCRLQTHVEQAQEMMRASQAAMEVSSNSTQPCP